MMNEEQQNKEKVYALLLKQKKPLFEEFKAKGFEAHERGEEGLSYTDFCIDKLTEAGLSYDQLILASSLIDLGIGIGQIQVLTELAQERKRTHEYMLPQPMFSA
jgi:hypothetical protein